MVEIEVGKHWKKRRHGQKKGKGFGRKLREGGKKWGMGREQEREEWKDRARKGGIGRDNNKVEKYEREEGRELGTKWDRRGKETGLVEAKGRRLRERSIHKKDVSKKKWD